MLNASHLCTFERLENQVIHSVIHTMHMNKTECRPVFARARVCRLAAPACFCRRILVIYSLRFQNEYSKGAAVKQRRITRILAMILAVSLVAGFLVGIFVVWPLLVPILLALGLAIYLYYRFVYKKRVK